ncbi:hypothetical protein [Clostridium magnum]|uniref:Uncharacterized protein n=1 Tax=Clostridium magnum DSM 2767 TaxID=1121326 RepID=A0A162RCW2_9CLOT|nr:hypothetical protein [Clostridium magnum]KZL89723.1 hypothetical protein CLMAG_47210 [Clostridium magnum DSM 2767]SHH64916.1 Predicted hydrolase, HAD superfamily [Clostridium magnum DSM 2767]
MNKNRIFDAIEKTNAKVVAFDIFDTVIHRSVSPNHVHRMWAKYLIDYYDLNMSINRLVLLKLNSRRFAKLHNVRKGLDKECRYDQMTKRIYTFLGIQESYNEFNTRCIDFELKIEKKVGHIDEKFLELYIELLNMNKDIIFISDFYLHGSTLFELLKAKGLDVKEQQVFSSSDFCKTKITGNLYQCVIEKLKIEPDKVVMVGDSKTSDYQNARLNGLNAYCIDSSKYYGRYKAFENEFQKNRMFLDLLLNEGWVKEREIPFSHVAFCMFPFVDNLYKQLRRDNRRNVFFLSREGELFKRLFDIYQEITIPNQQERINTYYLKVSRHATLIPSIFDVEKDSFQEIYKNYPDITLEAFLKNLGLEKNNAIVTEFEDTLIAKKMINDFKNSSIYDEVLKSEVFQRECTARAEQQRELFISYLDSFNVDYRSEGLSIVDVGYSGTTQENIKKIFSNEVAMYGYYMFSYANPKTMNSMNQKIGILYDKNNSKRKKDYFAYNSAVLELISLASHGSVNDYVTEGKAVAPTYDFIESEETAYKEVILPIQKNIEDAMRKICSAYSRTIFVKKDYYKCFMRQYRRFIFNPTLEEMSLYTQIPFVDNFAAYVTYDSSIVRKQSALVSIVKLILSCGRLIRKQNTHWVAVALDRLRLRLFNPLLYTFAPISLLIFDLLELLEKRKKGLSS